MTHRAEGAVPLWMNPFTVAVKSLIIFYIVDQCLRHQNYEIRQMELCEKHAQRKAQTLT